MISHAGVRKATDDEILRCLLDPSIDNETKRRLIHVMREMSYGTSVFVECECQCTKHEKVYEEAASDEEGLSVFDLVASGSIL